MMRRRQNLLILAFGACLLAACGSKEPPEQNSDGTWPPPQAWSDVSQNLVNAVHEKNPSASWWGRIIELERKLGSSDNYVAMRVQTNYRMDSAADVIDATDLCNALVTSIPREGFQVSVTGILTEGVTNADGSIETADDTRYRMTSGESWKENYPSKYCEARSLFTQVTQGLKDAGWTEWPYEDEGDPAKVFTARGGAQDGSIFFVDE